MTNKNDIDQTTGIETTGHEWDGIRELNNPLPRWWLWTFYATIIFSIGYMIYYPAIPLIEASTPGISGKTNRLALREEMESAAAAQSSMLRQISQNKLESIRRNSDLARFATAGGASAFKVYCSQCHGSGAQGGPGYPNLNDDDWIWGGDLDAIYTSIKHGIRSDDDDDTRYSVMPAFAEDGILDRTEIRQATHYILNITGQEHDSQLASAGKTVFKENCASCHAPNGTGIRELGSPDLTDAISLYGNTEETIVAQIQKPKHGVMPAWNTLLSDETIKQLAIYVHGLGGGEQAKAE